MPVPMTEAVSCGIVYLACGNVQHQQLTPFHILAYQGYSYSFLLGWHILISNYGRHLIINYNPVVSNQINGHYQIKHHPHMEASMGTCMGYGSCAKFLCGIEYITDNLILNYTAMTRKFANNYLND